MKKAAEHIHGYTYGTFEVPASAVSMRELDELKVSVGFIEENQHYLRLRVRYSRTRPSKSSNTGGAASELQAILKLGTAAENFPGPYCRRESGGTRLFAR